MSRSAPRRIIVASSSLALGLTLAACGGGTSSSTDPGTTAATQAASPTESAAPSEPVKIGYISLGESVPFVKIVSDSIKAEAEKLGVDLVFCDSALDAAKALDCGRQMATQEVQGVINYQVFQDSSPEICAAVGDVPVIAVDIVQPPCQDVFFGANDRVAGTLAGEAMGKYAKDNWDCDYTAYVSLESTAAGESNKNRMGGYRDGFQKYCPLVNERVLDGADRTDPALQQVSDLLTALPGERIMVVGITEDAALGALAAAKRLGRESDLFVSGQGTDSVAWKDIACNPQYIASTAFFPERYGQSVVPAMVSLLSGEAAPETINTEHELITKDNLRTVYPETPAC